MASVAVALRSCLSLRTVCRSSVRGWVCGMRVVQLTAENVKRLKAVDITPDGDVVVIAGKNAQGKSSVLDAIWMALAGGNATKGSPRAIRDGQKKAVVKLDLGELIVTRRWTEAGTTLEVTSAEKIDTPLGDAPKRRYSSPQAVLDALIGYLTFDPFRFSEASAKEQLGFLLSVVELPFKPEELAEERMEVFATRTDVNRDLGKLIAQIDGMPLPGKDVPDVEVSVVALAGELEDANTANQANDIAKRRLEVAREAVKAAEEGLVAARDAEQAASEAWGGMSELVDTEPLRAALASADEVNARVRAKQLRVQSIEMRDRAQAMADELTERLKEIDERKEKAISEAKMPLEGLGFDDEGVTYLGVPFSQASASERLRVGVAIAMALNPKIRVIRITDGSLLDSENMALLEEMAGANDFQIWIERVDETGTVGITIEDGMVVE